MAGDVIGVVEFRTLRRRQVFIAAGVGIVSLEYSAAEQEDIRVFIWDIRINFFGDVTG